MQGQFDHDDDTVAHQHTFEYDIAPIPDLDEVELSDHELWVPQHESGKEMQYALGELSVLNLAWAMALTSEGLSEVAAVLNRHAAARGATACALQVLDLRYCEKISDEGLTTLCERCPNLTAIDLTGCRNVSDRGIKSLLVHCKGSLNSLSLELCRSITDVGVQAAARSMGKTGKEWELNLGGCDQLTSVGIQIVAGHGRTLVRLNLSGCDNITDLDMEDVSSNCLMLKSLKLRACWRLTDGGAKQVYLS